MIFVVAFSFSTKTDRDKFDYIYHKYKNLMLHKAHEILKDPYLAEDAVSDAFLRIYRNIHKIADPQSNRCVAFVVTIVKNTALTIYNKAKRTRGEAVGDEILDRVEDESFDLETHVISNIAADGIYRLIDSLSEKRRQVFLLKYAYGYSHGEIGKLLGMSEGSVTVTLHRAKKTLMDMLSDRVNSGVGSEI